MRAMETGPADRSIEMVTGPIAASPNGGPWVTSLGPTALLLLLNFISFFGLSLVAFRSNVEYLFHGFDGRFEVTLIEHSTRFMPPMAGFANDFLHGLGNVPFVVNPWFLPEYFLALTTPGTFTDFPLAYAISATALFAGTYCLGRMLAAPRLTSLFAAWGLPLLSLQYAGWELVPDTFRAFPHYATITALANLLAALLLRIGRRDSVASAAIPALLFFAGITYVVIVAPTLLILVAPALVVFALVSLLACRTRRRLIVALGAMGAILAACLAAGYAQFIAGLVLYTAADEFKGLSVVPQDWSTISMLFWTPVSQRFFTVERCFVLLGDIGALWAALRAAGVLRLAAIAFLVTTAGYLGLGILHQYHRFWYGPQLWYFENFLFPYHAIFGALLLWDPVWKILRAPAAVGWLLRSASAERMVALGRLALVILPWFYLVHAQKLAGAPDLPQFTPYPQLETPITRILKREITLKPGAPFRGREATLNGRIFPDTISVDISGLSDIPNVLAAHATGNSHNTAGLWQDSIPTLVEYDPLMTPPYFAFTRSFFTDPVDIQVRNIVAMRRINPRLLAAIGVRFVITDRPFEGAMQLRQTLDVPVSEDYVRRLGLHRDIPSFTLYLYELNDANLGQYSPTKTRIVRTASAMLDALADPTLDLSRIAIVAEPVAAGLVPAHLIRFTVDRGSFTLEASSDGPAMLVLPMEYSRCLHLSQRADGDKGSRLVRADLLMTGVLFNGHLAATLKYRTGPFGNARCRLEDAKDMARMDMRDAFDKRPEFRP